MKQKVYLSCTVSPQMKETLMVLSSDGNCLDMFEFRSAVRLGALSDASQNIIAQCNIAIMDFRSNNLLVDYEITRFHGKIIGLCPCDDDKMKGMLYRADVWVPFSEETTMKPIIDALSKVSNKFQCPDEVFDSKEALGVSKGERLPGSGKMIDALNDITAAFDKYYSEAAERSMYMDDVNTIREYFRESTNKFLKAAMNISSGLALSDELLKLKPTQDQMDNLILQEFSDPYKQVRTNGLLIRHIQNKTEGLCYAAVRENGLAIQYIPIQTEELCMEAVKQNPMALEFIVNQSPEVCKEALWRNGMALQFVKNKTDSLCWEAISSDAGALRYVDGWFLLDLNGDNIFVRIPTWGPMTYSRMSRRFVNLIGYTIDLKSYFKLITQIKRFYICVRQVLNPYGKYADYHK